MGYAQPILGHVATVTRGIGVSDAASGTQGLPNPNPVYTWVRLAQRVPVRIASDSVPPGIPLVSGMSTTLTIEDGGAADDRPWLDRAVAEIETRLFDVLDGRQDAFRRPRPSARRRQHFRWTSRNPPPPRSKSTRISHRA
jgi:hypothetical protein